MDLHHDVASPVAGPLFYSDRGLYPFQQELTAYCVLRDNNLVAADMGLGKTIVALAASAILFEDKQIDTVLCLVENNKFDEWIADFAKFTPSLKVTRYRGSKSTRENRIKKGFGNVVLAGHETARNDLVERDPADKRQMRPGPLLRALKGRRMLIVLDEVTVYGGADSQMTQGLLYAIKQFGHTRKMGLTGTPMTTSPYSYYNIGKIICPELMQPKEQFWSDHVRMVNRFGQPFKFANLDVLAQRMSPVLLRKRKTDDDVRHQFPKTVEKFVPVHLTPAHLDVYERLDEIAKESLSSFTFDTLRAFANHPASLLESESKIALEYLDKYGVESLEGIRSTKSEHMIPDLKQMLAAGDQVLIFADHTRVLRALGADLAKEKIRFGMYSGDVTKAGREDVKAAFKAGEFPVLLLSSAGERGMNLPEAGYVINYDIPLRFSSYIQRLNRGSRIGSNVGGSLIVRSYMATGTVEEGSVGIWKRRNQWSDQLIDSDAITDEQFTSAADRADLIKAARERITKG